MIGNDEILINTGLRIVFDSAIGVLASFLVGLTTALALFVMVFLMY